MARNTSTAPQANEASENVNANTSVGVGSQVSTDDRKTIEANMAKIDLKSCGNNKSAKIRTLAAADFKTADIARHLGIKYQFVRNVLLQEQGRQAKPQS